MSGFLIHLNTETMRLIIFIKEFLDERIFPAYSNIIAPIQRILVLQQEI